jgi:hypothetical protein
MPISCDLVEAVSSRKAQPLATALFSLMTGLASGTDTRSRREGRGGADDRAASYGPLSRDYGSDGTVAVTIWLNAS